MYKKGDLVRILIGPHKDRILEVEKVVQEPPYEAYYITLPKGDTGMFFRNEIAKANVTIVSNFNNSFGK